MTDIKQTVVNKLDLVLNSLKDHNNWDLNNKDNWKSLQDSVSYALDFVSHKNTHHWEDGDILED